MSITQPSQPENGRGATLTNLILVEEVWICGWLGGWWWWDQVLSERARLAKLAPLPDGMGEKVWQPYCCGGGGGLILTPDHDVGRKGIHIVITDHFARLEHGRFQAQHFDIRVERGYLVTVGKHLVHVHVQIG